MFLVEKKNLKNVITFMLLSRDGQTKITDLHPFSALACWRPSNFSMTSFQSVVEEYTTNENELIIFWIEQDNLLGSGE